MRHFPPTRTVASLPERFCWLPITTLLSPRRPTPRDAGSTPASPQSRAFTGSATGFRRFFWSTARAACFAWSISPAGLRTCREPDRSSTPARVPTSVTRTTRSGGHVCLVLTPSQEVKVFAGGTMLFSLTNSRWRLLDIPSKFAAWREAVGQSTPPELALWLFQAALNLSESRTGALLVVARDPERAVRELIAPTDRMTEEVAADDPQDPDNLSPPAWPSEPSIMPSGRNTVRPGTVRARSRSPAWTARWSSIRSAVCSPSEPFSASPPKRSNWCGRCKVRADPRRARRLASTARSSRSARTATSPCFSRDGGSGNSEWRVASGEWRVHSGEWQVASAETGWPRAAVNSACSGVAQPWSITSAQPLSISLQESNRIEPEPHSIDQFGPSSGWHRLVECMECRLIESLTFH